MASHGFLVMVRNFEYDDNYYTAGREKHHKLFLSQESANEGVRRLTIKWFRDSFGVDANRDTRMSLSDLRGSYGETPGLFDMDDNPDCRTAFDKVFNSAEQIDGNVSDDDIWALTKFMSDDSTPYTVEPIEIEHPLS